MSDDLISRTDLKERIVHHRLRDSMKYLTSERAAVYEWVKGDMFGLVLNAPAEDAELIVHAYWEEVNPKGWMPWGYLSTPQLECSNCGEEAVNYSVSYSEQGGSVKCWNWVRTRRCPWCGAYMDGGKANG